MKTKLLWSIAILFFFGSIFVQAQTLNETRGTGSGVSITTGDYNTMYGDSTGTALTSNSQTTFIGFGAGKNNTARESTFIGYYAGHNNVNGDDNVFIGSEAGALTNRSAGSNFNGSDNTFIGTESGEDNTTGYDNTFVGEESGQQNTTGYENVFIGEDAGFDFTTGYENTFVGHRAGAGDSFRGGTGYKNTGVGNVSLEDIREGHHNTAIGDSSGVDIGNGIYNTMIGAAAGVATEYANFNTFVGAMAGWDNNRTNNTTDANRNTYLGYLSGASNREGEDNAGFGAFSGYGRAQRTTTGGEGYTYFGGNTRRYRTTFFGSQAIAAQNDVITMGYYSYNEGQYAIGIGNQGDMQNAVGAIGMGHQFGTTDSSDYSIGIGYQVNIAQSNAIGIGRSVDVDNTEAIAIGANAVAQNNGAIVIGTGAASNDLIDNTDGDPDASKNIAIGYNAVVSGNNAIAIGNGATAANDNTMILGGAVNPVSVGIGTVTPNEYASLDLTGTNKGLFVNRMTTAQRTALEPRFPTQPRSRGIRESEEGLMVYDTDEKALYFWNGTEWSSAIKDNLGDHAATTMLNMGDNVIRFDNGEDNGIEFNGRDRYKISYGGSTNYDYGPVTGVSIKTSMSTSADNGWTWGPYNAAPVAAISTEGKMQIANSLNIAGAYEFPIVDGTANQVLTTDGSGALTWSTQIDNQELSLNTNTLSISGGTDTVDLSGYLDNTDAQAISLATNTLSITGNAVTVDLSGYLDNTDNQDLSLSSNTLSLTNDSSTVDLSGYLDNTDAQSISLATNTLSISGNAATVDLSGYLDNTDNQDLSLSSNTLSLTNDASSVDLSGYLDNTDAQDLDLSGNVLSLTNDDTTVDLSSYLDNTDSQTLTLTNNNLSISGGNIVDLSEYTNTDHQDLTLATLNDTNLTIEIENGASVTVDLAPIVSSLESDLIDAQSKISNLEDENAAQQTEIDEQRAQINNLISRIEVLEGCACDTSGSINKGNGPILYQNIPNPFNGTSSIKYYLPTGITNASIVFSNSIGQLVSTVAIKQSGDGELNINSDGLASGTYFYTLYVGSQKIDSKKMVIE
ncbi:T9SS type A sorting domain-containing protein [Aquimarina sp. 2304DJ70-9]|uniref:T9SS type A sorting domain-containing protein n=1 Tax=Aquimarina penaris TaxID=3231044 RepID=UPI00346251EE